MFKKTLLFIAVLLLGVSITSFAQDQPDKMELRWVFIMGWQFYDVEDAKWKNVGLFNGDIRRAVSDVETARKIIDEVTWVSAGFYAAGAAGSVMAAVDRTCVEASQGNTTVRACKSGPLALIGGILSGLSGFAKQFVQGPYYNRAADEFNEAMGY